MPRSKNKKQKGKSGAFMSAPKQGLSSHMDWIMNDLQVATIPQTAAPGLYTLRVSCDCNGWSWVISTTGNDINTQPGNSFFIKVVPYGYDNN